MKVGVALLALLAALVFASIEFHAARGAQASRLAGGYSAEPASPAPSPARSNDETSVSAIYAVLVAEVWVPPAGTLVLPESPPTEPTERFLEPPEPPPRV